jgi:UPF0755 protein
MTKLISYAVALIVIFAVCAAAYEAMLKKPAASSPMQNLTFAAGMTSGQIADTLKKAGVISSASLFKAMADLTGSAREFHAGTFIFKQGMSALDVLRTLAIKGPDEIAVTIPEGYTLKQIADRLVAAGVLKSAGDFYAVVGESAKLGDKPDATVADGYPFLLSRSEGTSAEGFLFPDTYRFTAGMDPAAVVRKFLDGYKDKVAVLDPAPAYRTLVIASLVQAEVKDPADQAKVADIINRRLDKGMPLQLDSTVNYVTGKNDSAVSLKDRDTPSLWNTYLHAGLPPSPIDNPGLSAIRAALSPTPNPYLYFLTTPDGTVIYSKTLVEHNAAKQKYLK